MSQPYISLTRLLAKCREIYASKGEDALLGYLADVASNNYKCPDRCDKWALWFFASHETDITGGNQ
jgi:hypothetical protein